ncbi:hypoxanthine phosphoribosyltransferase [bacterium]|nr:hypoxanthine phosphoribosyltransferase [bacterium]
MKNLQDIKILYSEEVLQSKIQEIANKINEKHKGEEICAICVLKGSTPFCMDLIKRINLPLTLEFIRVSTYDGDSSTGKVNHLDMTLPPLDNKNVLIVEDIVDTGFTADFLLKSIKLKNNTKSLELVSLLNKKIARKIDVNIDYYGFEIDDKFVVGYGLDYNGYYRNLPYIGYF